MITKNGNVIITIAPKEDTDAYAYFAASKQPTFEVKIGGQDAVYQLDDLLNKFTNFSVNQQIQISEIITEFLKVHGYKIIEDGVVIP